MFAGWALGCSGGLAPSDPRHLSTPDEATPRVVVVRTTRDVPVGEVLEPTSLEAVEVPETLVPDDAPRSLDEVLGRATTLPLYAGDLVREPFLVGAPASGSRLATVVPLGMRALFYTPNDRLQVEVSNHVDLWWAPTDGPCVWQQAAFVLRPNRWAPHGSSDEHAVLITDEGASLALAATHHPTFRRTQRSDLDHAHVEGVDCP